MDTTVSLPSWWWPWLALIICGVVLVALVLQDIFKPGHESRVMLIGGAANLAVYLTAGFVASLIW